MSFKRQIIHLGIAFDSNYLKHFYALLTSVLKNNQKNKIHVHAIITGVSKREQNKIEEYINNNASSVTFYNIDEEFVKGFVLTNTWTSAVYYRLFFPLIVPEDVTRLIYLDTDIIVLKDLSALYSINLDGFPVGAVYDNYVKTAPQLGIHEEGCYFNSGMMLINVPAWKKLEISQKVFTYLAKYPENIKFVDQCGLNAVLINNWKKLDLKFNVLRSCIPEGMSRKEKKEFLRDKVLIHYTLDRPWKMLCQNPYRDLYFYYLKKSPYKLVRKYDDYSFKKVPAFLRIKVIDAYNDLPCVKSVWRKIKPGVKRSINLK